MLKCGTDIVEIRRIKKIVENTKFVSRYFTAKEGEFFRTKKNPYGSIAVNFAGKEAVAKAIGTGVSGFSLKDIEILRNRQGKPVVILYGTLEHLQKKYFMDISLSHTRHYATAMVVMMKK